MLPTLPPLRLPLPLPLALLPTRSPRRHSRLLFWLPRSYLRFVDANQHLTRLDWLLLSFGIWPPAGEKPPAFAGGRSGTVLATKNAPRSLQAGTPVWWVRGLEDGYAENQEYGGSFSRVAAMYNNFRTAMLHPFWEVGGRRCTAVAATSGADCWKVDGLGARLRCASMPTSPTRPLPPCRQATCPSCGGRGWMDMPVAARGATSTPTTWA